jgi:hypothetical protein
MFGWLKGNRGEVATGGRSSNGEPAIAALLIEGDSFPLEELRGRLAGAKFGGQAATEIEVKGGILMFKLGDEIVAVAPMPKPYPWSDLEGPCATSWMWPKGTSATEAVRPHRKHVLVTLIGGKADPVVRRLMLTQVTGLAAAVPGVLGVHWPEGTVVHYPPVFVKMAAAMRDPKVPPLYLWVDFRVVRNPDGTFAMFTTGLEKLGRMEIEIPNIAMGPGELREWSVNIAQYLLEAGDKVKDGDTIGMSATQQIRVRHKPSLFGKQGLVLQFQT